MKHQHKHGKHNNSHSNVQTLPAVIDRDAVTDFCLDWFEKMHAASLENRTDSSRDYCRQSAMNAFEAAERITDMTDRQVYTFVQSIRAEGWSI